MSMNLYINELLSADADFATDTQTFVNYPTIGYHYEIQGTYDMNTADLFAGMVVKEDQLAGAETGMAPRAGTLVKGASNTSTLTLAAAPATAGEGEGSQPTQNGLHLDSDNQDTEGNTVTGFIITQTIGTTVEAMTSTTTITAEIPIADISFSSATPMVITIDDANAEWAKLVDGEITVQPVNSTNTGSEKLSRFTGDLDFQGVFTAVAGDSASWTVAGSSTASNVAYERVLEQLLLTAPSTTEANPDTDQSTNLAELLDYESGLTTQWEELLAAAANNVGVSTSTVTDAGVLDNICDFMHANGKIDNDHTAAQALGAPADTQFVTHRVLTLDENDTVYVVLHIDVRNVTSALSSTDPALANLDATRTSGASNVTGAERAAMDRTSESAFMRTSLALRGGRSTDVHSVEDAIRVRFAITQPAATGGGGGGGGSDPIDSPNGPILELNYSGTGDVDDAANWSVNIVATTGWTYTGGVSPASFNFEPAGTFTPNYTGAVYGFIDIAFDDASSGTSLTAATITSFDSSHLPSANGYTTGVAGAALELGYIAIVEF